MSSHPFPGVQGIKFSPCVIDTQQNKLECSSAANIQSQVYFLPIGQEFTKVELSIGAPSCAQGPIHTRKYLTMVKMTFKRCIYQSINAENKYYNIDILVPDSALNYQIILIIVFVKYFMPYEQMKTLYICGRPSQRTIDMCRLNNYIPKVFGQICGQVHKTF